MSSAYRFDTSAASKRDFRFSFRTMLVVCALTVRPGDPQPARHPPVLLAARQQEQHLQLTLREPGEVQYVSIGH